MMKADSRLRIAVFFGITALALVALLVVARYPSLFKRGQEYQAIFRSVNGINVGDEVRYGGLLVGSITGLELDPTDHTRILATFRVRSRTPIRADTRAGITQVGLLGQPFLNLTPGRADSPPLAPGNRVSSDDNLTFQDAMSRLAFFLDRADSLLMGVERFAGAGPWDRINQTITRMDSLVVTARYGSDRIFSQLDTASLRLSEVLSRTDRVIAGIDTTMKSVRPQFTKTSDEAVQALRELRSLASDLRAAMLRGDRLDDITRNIAVASDNIARVSERLERDPTSLLKQRRAPKKPAGPKPRE